MKAYLILENGKIYEGQSIGAKKDVIAEIVFNTSMVGYVEQLTDPSYRGQAVCMTYPLIGNYGVCLEDCESKQIHVRAYIVRELSRIPSNFRNTLSIQDFLIKNDVPGIAGIDTRDLTLTLREYGTMNGFITTDENYHLDEILPKIKAYKVGNVVPEVTCHEAIKLDGVKWLSENGALAGSVSYGTDAAANRKAPSYIKKLTGAGLHIAVWDFGAKDNIVRSLRKRGCDVTIYPALTKFDEIRKDAPDGIMLSNGPGDPEECTEIIKEIRLLYDAGIPTFAICLGHQLMALAAGLSTYKLKYGHRGANHPVKDLTENRVYISSQNHGYAVNTNGLEKDLAAAYFINVNDGTNEGLRYTNRPIETVQFHPEASPGPQDTAFLFDRFLERVGDKNANK